MIASRFVVRGLIAGAFAGALARFRHRRNCSRQLRSLRFPPSVATALTAVCTSRTTPARACVSIKLRHVGGVAGAYKITVTARLNKTLQARSSVSHCTASVNLGTTVGTTSPTSSARHAGSSGSRITFAITATGAWDRVLRHRPRCLQRNVTETEDTSAPLSISRRDLMGYEVRGRAATQTFYDCPFGTGGDHIARGVCTLPISRARRCAK